MNNNTVNNSTVATDRLQSPCVGLCSTAFGDTVCRGCKRFAREIDYWFTYEDGRKAEIMDRIGNMRRQLLEEHLEIFDIERLQAALQQYAVNYNAALEPHWWVFSLMRQTLARSPSPEACGLRFKVPGDMGTVWEQMETRLYAMSEQHYQQHGVR